jgi:hypothetical protein
MLSADIDDLERVGRLEREVCPQAESTSQWEHSKDWLLGLEWPIKRSDRLHEQKIANGQLQRLSP